MTVIDSFVAIFDFLGFKALREARGTRDLFDLFQKTLLPDIEHAAAGSARANGRGYVPNPGPMSLRAMLFSDTIVLLPDGCDYTRLSEY